MKTRLALAVLGLVAAIAVGCDSGSTALVTGPKATATQNLPQSPGVPKPE